MTEWRLQHAKSTTLEITQKFTESVNFLKQQWHEEKTTFKEGICRLTFRKVTQSLLNVEIQTGTSQSVTFRRQWQPDS